VDGRTLSDVGADLDPARPASQPPEPTSPTPDLTPELDRGPTFWRMGATREGGRERGDAWEGGGEREERKSAMASRSRAQQRRAGGERVAQESWRPCLTKTWTGSCVGNIVRTFLRNCRRVS
jgi:hypothetical protein